MKIPKFCYDKFFLTAISASFAFTLFVYGVLDSTDNHVKAELDQIQEKIEILPVLVEMQKENHEDIKIIKCYVTSLC